MNEKPLKIDEMVDDPICKKWLMYCLADDKQEPLKWYREKAGFWDENRQHLTANGFEYNEGKNLANAFDIVSVDKFDNLKGCLLVIKIGSDTRPASPQDINSAFNLFQASDIAKDSQCTILISHHVLDIQKLSPEEFKKLTDDKQIQVVTNETI